MNRLPIIKISPGDLYQCLMCQNLSRDQKTCRLANEMICSYQVKPKEKLIKMLEDFHICTYVFGDRLDYHFCRSKVVDELMRQYNYDYLRYPPNTQTVKDFLTMFFYYGQELCTVYIADYKTDTVLKTFTPANHVTLQLQTLIESKTLQKYYDSSIYRIRAEFWGDYDSFGLNLYIYI